MARSWPLMQCLADFTAGPPNLPSISSVDLLAASSQTALQAFVTGRGRQYELGTVQAGTLTLDLTDSLERLNPVNSGSPWNSGANSLLPYRCVQLGAWWNPSTKDVTGNMLNASNQPPASGGQTFDPSFETSAGGWGNFGTAVGIVTSTTQAFVGTHSLACTFTASPDVAGFGLWTSPGRQYTVSLYVFVPASHTVTATFYNFPGSLGSSIASATSSATGAWQRLTMTGVPSGAVSAVQLKVATGTFSTTVFVDAVQSELGAVASAFSLTGPIWFPVFTGYIERYPQSWDMAGFRGRKPLQAVDALSPLSRTIISQSYAATALADGPSVFVPYDDDAFPQVVQRPTGGQQMIPYQALGSQSAAVTFGGDTFPDGSKALTLSQQNADPLTSGDNTQVTRLGTRYGAVVMDPTAFTFEIWVRWTAGQVWFGAGSLGAGESTTDPTLHDGPLATFGVRTNNNSIGVYYKDSNGVGQLATSFIPSTLVFADNSWHHLLLMGVSSTAWRSSRDTFVRNGTYNVSSPPSMKIDNIYAYVNTFYGDVISTSSFANAAIYNYVLSSTQIAAHYQRGIGYFGEMSGARALRLLTKYWSTNVVTDTGKSSMAADFSYNGRNMLEVLQEIADTEAGLVWVDSAGAVHQDSRETRYVATTSATSQFTFGENTAGGELPYLELDYDYDPTYVFSEADFTSGGTGTQIPPVVNATSQTAYGQRILSKTLQMAVDWDVQQAAQFYVQRYAKPAGTPGSGTAPRISKMTIDPASNPNLWAAVLDLDVDNRVTVKRRTSAGVTVSGDYYIEQINHNVNAEASTWTVDYQLSPVFVSQVWILGDATKSVLGTTTVCVY